MAQLPIPTARQAGTNTGSVSAVSTSTGAWKNAFLPCEEPLQHIGLSATIVGLYEDILKFASQEKTGYQEMISSIVLHILGTVYYKRRNNSFTNTYVVDKINEALHPDERAGGKPADTGRNSFPPGARLLLVPPYVQRIYRRIARPISIAQKLLKAKELLTSSSMNISEIAYSLKFENAGQFSTFFKKKEGVTPSEFRERAH